MTGSLVTGALAGVGIAIQDVTAEYYPGQPILRGLTLAAAPGQISVIIGPNGSGKSTALRVLAGLLPPRAGEVLLRRAAGDQAIGQVPAHGRSTLGISFLPQGHSVFPALSVHDNLMLGSWPIRRDRRRRAAAVNALYDRYPILRTKRHALAGGLSGGQQRILELARALACDPTVLLIDEPSAGVAPAIAVTMYEELAQLRREGRTIVLVDQDVRPALAIADTVFVLKSGQLDRSGPASVIGGDLDALIRDWLATSQPTQAPQ